MRTARGVSVRLLQQQDVRLHPVHGVADHAEVLLDARFVGGFDHRAAVHEKIRVVAECAVADVPDHGGQRVAQPQCFDAVALNGDAFSVGRLKFRDRQKSDQSRKKHDDAQQKKPDTAQNAHWNASCFFHHIVSSLFISM